MLYGIDLRYRDTLFFSEYDSVGTSFYWFDDGSLISQRTLDDKVESEMVFDYSAVKKALAAHPETPRQSQYNSTWAYAYWLSAVWLASCGAEWSNEAIASLRVHRTNDQARDLVQSCVTRFFTECSQDPEKIRRFVDGI